MTNGDTSTTMPGQNDTTTNETDAGVGSSRTAPATAEAGKRVFEVLSSYFLEGLPAEARREVYMEVLTRVNDDRIPGLLHRGNVIKLPMPLTGGAAKRTPKPLEELLLKAQPGLHALLEDAAMSVMRRQVVQERGRGLSVSELEELGDDLDFDALVEQDRLARSRAAKIVAASAKNRATGAKPKAPAGKRAK